MSPHHERTSISNKKSSLKLGTESSRSSITAMSSGFKGNIALLPPPEPSRHLSINCLQGQNLFLMNFGYPANNLLRCAWRTTLYLGSDIVSTRGKRRLNAYSGC